MRRLWKKVDGEGILALGEKAAIVLQRHYANLLVLHERNSTYGLPLTEAEYTPSVSGMHAFFNTINSHEIAEVAGGYVLRLRGPLGAMDSFSARRPEFPGTVQKMYDAYMERAVQHLKELHDVLDDDVKDIVDSSLDDAAALSTRELTSLHDSFYGESVDALPGILKNIFSLGRYGSKASSERDCSVERYLGWAFLERHAEMFSSFLHRESKTFERMECPEPVEDIRGLSDYYAALSTRATAQKSRMEQVLDAAEQNRRLHGISLDRDGLFKLESALLARRWEPRPFAVVSLDGERS